MELHQLRYFERVATYESISRAADELHITQPALSKSIAKLEEELGTKLFEREGKRLSLNNEGRFLLQGVQKCLRDLDDTARSLSQLATGHEGTLRIGVFGPQHEALACTVAFMESSPNVRVVFDARQSYVGHYPAREYDVLFYAQGEMFKDVIGVPYSSNRLMVALPEGHELAGQGSVSLDELKDEQFIFMNTTAGIYEQSYRLCLDSGFYPLVRAVVSSGAAQIAMIRAGFGIGLVDGLMQQNGIPGLALLELESALPEQVLCFACTDVESLSPVAHRFIEHVFAFFGIPYDYRAKMQLRLN